MFRGRRATADHRRDPTRRWCPLPTQHAFLRSRHGRRLLRAGNQWGKTTAGVIDLIEHVTGGHVGTAPPDVLSPHPITAWVICASWSQSIEIQRKIWELLPKDLLHPSAEFTAVNGFRGKNPTFRIRHKSGGWSIVRIKTMGQGGLRLASATIQYAWFDEPPESQRIYSEITKRVLRAGRYGRVIMTMTPVNAPVEWIREAAENGTIEDHHARMEPHEYVPMVRTSTGWAPGVTPLRLLDGTVCDQEWISEAIAGTLAHEVPVVCHGEWRMSADAPVFSAFRQSGPRAHVSSAVPRGSVEILLGIDHGVRTHTQVAVLVALADDGSVWVLDEYVGETATTEADDAEGILRMLERRGMRWVDLDQVHGDRAHAGQARGPGVAKKSNEILAKALVAHPRASKHGIKRELSPRIQKAKRGVSNKGGSVEWGCTWLHRAMVRDEFRIHPRCSHGISAILGYDMTPNSAESHWVDGLRYALRPAIWASGAPERLAVHVSV